MNINIHTPSSKAINKNGISSANFLKILKYQISFKKPFSGSRVVPSGEMDRQTETTKLILDTRNFTNAPTNRQYLKPMPLVVRTAFGGRPDEIFNDAMILKNKCHFTRLVLYVDSFRYQHPAVRFNFSQSNFCQPNFTSYNGNFSFVQRLRLSLIQNSSLV